MTQNLCDVCKRRPAEIVVTLIRNGRREVQHLCRYDYAALRQRQQGLSPFSSLFGGMGVGDPFDDDVLGASGLEELASKLGFPIPRHREGMSLDQLLTQEAKEYIEKAGQYAVERGVEEVDTEHLLFVLLKHPVVDNILKAAKVDVDLLARTIEGEAPKGSSKREAREIRVSPRVKFALEEAVGQARELGHDYVGPEHLLLGLAREEEGLAGLVLRRLGTNAEQLRQKTIKIVGKGAGEGRAGKKSPTPTLDQYSRNLTELARQGKLDPVIGRAEEIETTIEILSRRTKNNPVLIGEPGVGKTAIVEGLAQRIVAGEVPEALEGRRVVELNLNALVAGSKYRGEFEERAKKILDEIRDQSDELIVFIDELHTIMGAGSAEGGLDIANTFKPALARGELHLIGATTLNEYQKHIEKDAALERRFQPVFVAEPTVEQTIEILRGLRDRYEAHHKVQITDEAIVAAAELSDRYITNRFLPDKAIDLVDQAAARVRILASTESKELADLEEETQNLKKELAAAQAHKDFTLANKLERKLEKLEARRKALEAEWKKVRSTTTPQVTREHIAQVVSRITGIPVAELTQEEREKLLKMEERIHERVVGQEEAVTAVANAIRRSRAGIARANRPIATFLFLGPTGVGKTELAKTIARVVFGDESAMVRLDMSEYMERFAVSRLVGAPPGYVGYEEGGQLTEPVRRRPYTVLLLDEIEKAHPDVFNILLQVFDEGRLTDAKGRTIDFTNTIIIATSNIGSAMILDNQRKPEAERLSYKELRDKLLQELRLTFRPEFLNRIDEIIVFHGLTKEQTRSIAELRLAEVARLAHGQGVVVRFDDSLIDHLVEKGYSPEFGARELNRAIQNEVENALARWMLAGDVAHGDEVLLCYDAKKGVLFEKVSTTDAPQKGKSNAGPRKRG